MPENITVEKIYRDNQKKLRLKSIGENLGSERFVVSTQVNRPGLELSGFWEYFDKNRIQIFGLKEKHYLNSVPEDRIKSTFKKLFSYGIPAAIFAHRTRPSEMIVELANKYNIPLFLSSILTNELGALIMDYLSWHLAPSMIVHGSLVDVYGVGLLFTGRSGIGKSEVALDLVERGHRLVADDVIRLIKRAENVIIGSGLEILEHHIEVRGIGIIDVNSIFGVRAIRQQKRVEVQVELEDWSKVEDYERIGADENYTKILGVDIPLIKLPIFPGKNITVIAEVIALNQLLKVIGKNAAKEFEEKLRTKIKEKRTLEKMQKYLNKDYE